MTQSCTACGRTNTLQRTACIYCGEPLPGVGTEESGANDGPVMPEDLDQLVRQAMTLGTTAHLEKAFAAQAEAQQAEAVPTEDQPSRGDLLGRLLDMAQEAIDAEAAGDEGRLSRALSDARRTLTAIPVVVAKPEPPPPVPVVMLPKVRRRFSLVVEGVGDVELHGEFVNHLRLDAVTARMMHVGDCI